MELIIIPCLKDNYAYLITCPVTRETAVIDSGSGPEIASEVTRRGLDLVAIFSTHHHWDHTDGNAYLCDRFLDLRVYGSHHDAKHGRIPRQTHAVGEGDEISIGTLRFRILDIPGHTLGQVAYVGEGVVFAGDTLFVAGCGRLFEGTPEMMLGSLEKLSALPGDTLLYCGHEYTERNLEFARYIEPESKRLEERYAIARDLRSKRLATVPSSIVEERETNPFLRARDPEFVRALERAAGKTFATPADVFAATRAMKDSF